MATVDSAKCLLICTMFAIKNNNSLKVCPAKRPRHTLVCDLKQRLIPFWEG